MDLHVGFFGYRRFHTWKNRTKLFTQRTEKWNCYSPSPPTDSVFFHSLQAESGVSVSAVSSLTAMRRTVADLNHLNCDHFPAKLFGYRFKTAIFANDHLLLHGRFSKVIKKRFMLNKPQVTRVVNEK